MKKIITLFIFLVFLSNTYSQNQSAFYQSNLVKFITTPVSVDGSGFPVPVPGSSPFGINTSEARWNYQDPSSIGGNGAMSGPGNLFSLPWNLNNKRLCLYDSLSSNPVWTYTAATNANDGHSAMNDSGTLIVFSSGKNILMFNKNSNVPVNNFNLTVLPDTGNAGPVDMAMDGSFYIGTAVRSDTSTVLRLNADGTQGWKLRVPTTVYGVNISRNDSLVIVNTYSKYWVVNTHTGEVRFQGDITYGTQAKQGISGNGTYIALIDYRGYTRLLEWNGSAYVLKWTVQETPGSYYNWITAVDISEDGQYVVNGSLIFLTSSSFDGRIKVYKISAGNTPVWSYVGCGDEVQSVAFSRNGNIVSAASWGDLAHTKSDLVVFKTRNTTGIPLYTLKTSGSMFYTSVSNDGRSVFATGKAVHARQMGSGGLLYNIAIDTNENPVNITAENSLIPDKNYLHQNYPNPFNPSTNINFDLKDNGAISLDVYDVSGKLVRRIFGGFLSAGTYNINFNASGLGSGIYFCRMQSGDFVQVNKLILVK